MFQKAVSIFAVSALITTPLAAAEDFKVSQPGQRDSAVRTGLGAQASLRIKLGDARAVRKADRITVAMAAGPALSVRGATAKIGISPLLGISMRPGYESSFSLAGQRLAASYTRRGFAEAQKDGRLPKGRRNGVSTGGWIAIGVGALAAVVLVTFLTCTNEPSSGVDCGIAGD